MGTAFLFREAYYQYHNNYTIVNLFTFSTVYLMPIYSYFLNQIIPLNNDVTILTNLNDSIIATIILFVGSALYFKGKFKSNQIHNLRVLLLLSFVILNTFYFGLKTIQTYNSTLLYTFVMLFIALKFLFLSFYTKEKQRILKPNLKRLKYAFFAKTFFHILYIKAIAFIPVEIAPIVRRIAQLSSGLILDKKKLVITEILGLSIIFGYFIYIVFQIII